MVADERRRSVGVARCDSDRRSRSWTVKLATS
jgi:hypothetical protein